MLDASFVAQLDALGCWRSLIYVASALRRPDGGDGAAASLAALLSRRPPPDEPPAALLSLLEHHSGSVAAAGGAAAVPGAAAVDGASSLPPLDAAPLTVEVEKLLAHEIEARPSDDSAGGGVGAAAHRALATRARSQFRRSAELRHLVGAHAPAEALSLLLREFAPAEILRGGATARLLDELVALRAAAGAAPPADAAAARDARWRDALISHLQIHRPLLARLNGSVDERGATFAADATRLDPTLEAEAEARARTLTDVVGSGGGGASSAAALELAMVTKVAEEAKELRAALAEYKRERDGVSAPAAAPAPAGAAALLAGGAGSELDQLLAAC